MPRAKAHLRENDPRWVVTINFRNRSKEKFLCNIFLQKLRNSTRLQLTDKLQYTLGFKGKNASENQLYLLSECL